MNEYASPSAKLQPELSPTRSLNKKYASIYQDLRTVQKPYTETYLQADFTLNDVLTDLSFNQPTDECSGIVRTNGYIEISAEDPLFEPLKPTFLRNTHLLFRNMRKIYTTVSIIQLAFLFGVYTHLFPLFVDFMYKNFLRHYDFAMNVSLCVYQGLQHLENLNFFLPLALAPMPILYTILNIRAAKHISERIRIINYAIADRLKRKVNFSTHQSFNKSLNVFSEFVSSYFETDEELKKTGIQQMKENLQKWIDRMNISVFSTQNFQHELCFKTTTNKSQILQVLDEEVDIIWKPIYLMCFVFPSFLYLIIIYSFLMYVWGSDDGSSWYFSYLELLQLIKNPINLVKNRSFQVIILIFVIQIITVIWMNNVLSENFLIWILNDSGLFNRVLEKGLVFINQWIKRVWELGVLQPIVPYIKSRKPPPS